MRGYEKLNFVKMDYYGCATLHRSPVVVQMQERVIKYVVVTIKKVYRGIDSSKVRSASVCVIKNTTTKILLCHPYDNKQDRYYSCKGSVRFL